MSIAERVGRRRSSRVFLAFFLIFGALMSIWAWTTPIAASPDEPAHIIKAASVVRGEWIGSRAPYGQAVNVPAYIAFSQTGTCTANKPAQTADCAPALSGDPFKTTIAATTAGLYNPLYYLIVGWPSLVFSDGAGIFAMRLVSGLVSSLFIALSASVLAGLPRPALPLAALAIASTPMVIFLSASVNPNGLEVTATVATFVTMMAIAVSPNERGLARKCALVAVAAAVAVNMRGISPLWVAIAVFVPLALMSAVRLRALFARAAVRWLIVVVGISTGASLLWTYASGSLSSGLDNQTEIIDMPYTGASPLLGFFGTLDATFSHAQNMVGIFGWLDTPVPLGVYFVWSVFVGILAIPCLLVLRGRPLTVVVGLGAAVVFVPAVLQAIYIGGGGFIWQGRYTLALFACFIVAMGVLLAERFDTLPALVRDRTVTVVTGLWLTAQFASLAQSIRRYSVGIAGSWIKMITEPHWSLLGGNLLWLVMGLLVITGASVVLLLAGRDLRQRRSSSVQRERDDVDDETSGGSHRQREDDSVEQHHR